MHIDHIFVAGGRGSRNADPSISKFIQKLSGGVSVEDFVLKSLEEFPEAKDTWVL